MSYRWIEIDSDDNVYPGEKIIIKSTSPLNLTLPTSPSVGDAVSFLDGAGLCGTNNTTINRNNKKIMGLNENLIINSDGASFSLVYKDANRGWVLK